MPLAGAATIHARGSANPGRTTCFVTAFAQRMGREAEQLPAGGRIQLCGFSTETGSVHPAMVRTQDWAWA